MLDKDNYMASPGQITLIKMALNIEDFLHQNNILKYIEFEDEESLNVYTKYVSTTREFISYYNNVRVEETLTKKEKDEGKLSLGYFITSRSYEFVRADCDRVDAFINGDITVYGSISVRGKGEIETCELSAYFKSNELNSVLIFDHGDDTEIILMDDGVSK